MILTLDPPLDPSPDEARSWLQRELLRPEYYEDNLVQRLLTWLVRTFERGLQAASDSPPLTTFAAMLIGLLLVLGLGWLVARARRSPAAARRKGSVLTDETVSASELRARAEAALADGRYAEALVDGFRALAVRQVERGRLDDLPAATAREVARALEDEYPREASRVESSARLFDLVLYGDRPATQEQATGVLGLDDELAEVR